MVPCSAVPDDAYVVDASYMGAPTVSIEKLDSSQAEAAAHAVLKVRSVPLLLCVLLRLLWDCRTGCLIMTECLIQHGPLQMVC